MEPIRKSPVQGRKAGRSLRSLWLLVMAAFLNTVPSAACETHVGKLGSSPLKTRKPVLNAVLIDHGGGWQTLYGRLESYAVHQGDCLSTGSVLGKLGSTGRTEGPVLHFEVRINGRPTDPMLVSIAQDAAGSKG